MGTELKEKGLSTRARSWSSRGHMRRPCVRIRAQAGAEGLCYTSCPLLTIAVPAKRCVPTTGRQSHMQAVLGYRACILPDLDGEGSHGRSRVLFYTP